MIEFESIQNHDNINQTGLKRQLVTIIDGELGADDIKFLKFLCQDHIGHKTLEKIKDGIQIFNELERLRKIDTSRGEVDYLLECLCRCHRNDLIRKMGFNQIQVKYRVESGHSNFSPFRLLLFELAKEMETTDYKKALFTLSSVIPPWKHDKIKSICDVLIQLERSGDLSPLNVEVLYKLLKMMDRGDLISKVRAYQEGAQPTGGNTKYIGYGPPEEGQVYVPRTIESKEPEYKGEGQIPPANTVEPQRPRQATKHSIQFTGNQLPLEQFQNVTASVIPRVNNIQGVIQSQREPVDIRGTRSNKNSRTEHDMDDYMRNRFKMQDKENYRAVPSLKYKQNPVFWGLQQEQPSPGTNPSVKGVGNQTPTEPSPFYRTGIISEVPVNHLVHHNDVITEEHSPGDSGISCETVSLPDIPLSITESNLVELSEVIARREDWMQLAFALMIDYDQTAQIMQANPTNVLRVHGFLKHWFIEQRNRLGTSPSADGLLDAFLKVGFTDAIEEFVRLSHETESELEQDKPLSITESKLVELSKVIARRDDCILLASVLMIDYDQTAQIIQANPTNVLRVHGFLKHWFIEQRNRLGTSPSADGLLIAFHTVGFTDAIEEYVRLSREPDAELQQGAQPTGGKTEIGYGPVEEGQVPILVEIAMEPEYQGEGQIPPANTVEQQKTTRATPANTVEQQRPTQATAHSVQCTSKQLPLFLEEFQNLTASVNRSINDIQGQGQNKHSRTDPYMHEYMRTRLKMEDRENVRSRVVPSLQENPVNLGSQQEQPSPGTHPSVRGVGNQTPTEPLPFYRTGTSSEVPVNHLVHRYDVITEEQSPGDIGLTAGTVFLLDRSSQEISSGDILLSITESNLVGLSEVIARREDWMQLAFALMIDYDRITQIMQANPTNVLRVHGILKHWFIEQRKRLGTSPSAEGLLKAFQRLGFTNAIEEYVRLSREPEAELEQGSENLAVQSEFLLWNRVQNFNVSSDLDPRMDPRIRKPIFQVDAIVRQIEVVAIDDSDMPFYKMNARPRGLAIIINNEHFHKIKNDQSSMGMPTRTGTNKDEEKLEYIWSKLDFGVQIYNDVDSTRMNQIMLETASRDHSMYDCLVVTILTHGILGHVYGADGRIVRISQLTSCVSGRRCPSLAGKPKLFFIQACQGTEKQAGHAIETDAGGSMPDEGQDLNVNRQRELIPDEADFLLGYATVPGYVSYRSRSQGSWYINELTLNLDKYADKHDLLSILIKVNEEVGRATATIGNGDYKQIPAPMITLRKQIIFR